MAHIIIQPFMYRRGSHRQMSQTRMSPTSSGWALCLPLLELRIVMGSISIKIWGSWDDDFNHVIRKDNNLFLGKKAHKI